MIIVTLGKDTNDFLSNNDVSSLLCLVVYLLVVGVSGQTEEEKEGKVLSVFNVIRSAWSILIG